MKPLEILLSLPKWAKTTPAQILESPAFALPCRLGEESVTLRLGGMPSGDTLDIAITLGDEQNVLSLSRSASFPELDKVWDSRGDIPEPILLALAEKECGVLFQLIENAVRRQFRVVSLAPSPDASSQRIFAQVSGMTFALTLTENIVNALGMPRNLDLSDASIREESLPAEIEYAAFALSAADISALEVGDALLIPEVGSIPPRLIVDGRFSVDGTGVSRFTDDGRCRVLAAEPVTATLGEIFDAATEPHPVAASAASQLRLVQNGRTIARGRLDRLGDQPSFTIESTDK